MSVVACPRRRPERRGMRSQDARMLAAIRTTARLDPERTAHGFTVTGLALLALDLLDQHYSDEQLRSIARHLVGAGYLTERRRGKSLVWRLKETNG